MTNIPVTIPDYGDNYKLDGKISVESKIDIEHKNRYVRLEVLDRLSTLKEETAFINPIVPILVKSSKFTPVFSNF